MKQSRQSTFESVKAIVVLLHSTLILWLQWHKTYLPVHMCSILNEIVRTYLSIHNIKRDKDKISHEKKPSKYFWECKSNSCHTWVLLHTQGCRMILKQNMNAWVFRIMQDGSKNENSSIWTSGGVFSYEIDCLQLQNNKMIQSVMLAACLRQPRQAAQHASHRNQIDTETSIDTGAGVNTETSIDTGAGVDAGWWVVRWVVGGGWWVMRYWASSAPEALSACACFSRA